METVLDTTQMEEAVLLEYTTLSEPEDSMSSDVDSFDEEDMYPVDYDDESVGDSLDQGLDSDKESQSYSGTMVRSTTPIF